MFGKQALSQAHRKMREIRIFEERLYQGNTSGDIPGFIHLYTDEEAIAVGVCGNLTSADFIGSAHRGHGHCITKGYDVRGTIVEILGKDGGLCRDKDGSMHIAGLSKGMLGTNAIAGEAPPLVIDVALTVKMLKTSNVDVPFTGDGGPDQDLVLEAINMAIALQLPTVFILGNSGCGEGAGHDYTVGGRDIARRIAGFGLPAVTVDGTDFFVAYEVTLEAIKRTREGGGPSVIKAKVFRRHGHFEGDPTLYRVEGEVRRLREQHDPLKISAAKVERHITQEELAAIDEEVETPVSGAISKTRVAAYPAPEDLLVDMYVSH